MKEASEETQFFPNETGDLFNCEFLAGWEALVPASDRDVC